MGQNLDIGFRFADNRYDLLPTLGAGLVRRRMRAIVASGAVNAALAAKAATDAIPIVFYLASGGWPASTGPAATLLGVTGIGREVLAKRLEMLRELLPGASVIGLLVNPDNPNTQPSVSEVPALANAGGWLLYVVTANSLGDLDGVIAKLVQLKAGAFLAATDSLFSNFLEIVPLAERHRIPTIPRLNENPKKSICWTACKSCGQQAAVLIRIFRVLTATKYIYHIASLPKPVG